MDNNQKNTIEAVYVFDVCGTLVKEDTTLGLLAWHFKRVNSYVNYCIISLVKKKYSPVRLLILIAEKLFNRHIGKMISIRLLRKTRLEQLEISAEEYAKYLLTEKLISDVYLIFNKAKNEKAKIILASASLNPIVKCLANAMQVDYVSSRLACKDGRLNGRLDLDISGKKETEITNHFGESVFGNLECCVSDNLSDLRLMKHAKNRFIVVHNHKNLIRWKKLLSIPFSVISVEI